MLFTEANVIYPESYMKPISTRGVKWDTINVKPGGILNTFINLCCRLFYSLLVPTLYNVE
jgi:hypothetical protein